MLTILAENYSENDSGNWSSPGLYVVKKTILGIRDKVAPAVPVNFSYVLPRKLSSGTLRNTLGPRWKNCPFIPPFPGRYFSPKIVPELNQNLAAIQTARPNCVLTLGEIPYAFVCDEKLGKGGYSTVRGSLCQTKWGAKLIPTHPLKNFFADWRTRPIFFADIHKALHEAQFPETRIAPRRALINPTIPEIRSFLQTILFPRADEPCGVDIETKQETVTEIGFSFHDVGIVIPLYDHEKNCHIWPGTFDTKTVIALIQEYLTVLKFPVFQNGLYDLKFLWRTLRIQVPHAGPDTMLLAHAMHPELRKSLGFLTSIYTTSPHWKTMRSGTEYKKEDD